MRVPSLSRTLLLAALALPLALSTSPARADRMDGTADAARPRYRHSEEGFRHFVEDRLAPLVEGQTWTADGHTYEVVKLHSIKRTYVTRWSKRHENSDVPHRGWSIGVVHVKVDGRLMRGRVEGTARFVLLPDGWEWDQVLLYLGRNASYDFVKRSPV